MQYQLVLYTIYNTTTLSSLYHRHHLHVSYYSQFNYHHRRLNNNTRIFTIPTMPPKKKRKTTSKPNTSDVDEQALFEELPAAGVVVAAVTQMSQDTAVDEYPRRRSPRRSKASTTASSLSSNHDDGGAEGQEEEAGAGGQEEEATTESTVEETTELSRLFLGNASYAEAYANNPSEAYNQLYLLLYPRLSRFQLPTTQYMTTGLYQTDFPLENDAIEAINQATLIPALSELQRDPYFYLNAIPLFMAGPSSGHHQEAKDLSRLLGLSQIQIDLIINSVDWTNFNYCVRIFPSCFQS